MRGTALRSRSVRRTKMDCQATERRYAHVTASLAGDAPKSTLPSGQPSRRNKNILTNIAILTAIGGALILKGIPFEMQQSHGLTLMDLAMNIPGDIWEFYLSNSALHPLLTPAVITGITYVLADWISQTFEGKFALDFDSLRLLRAGLIGFCLLGPLAHYYYTFQDVFFKAFFVFLHTSSKPWWSFIAHIALDQSLYVGFYNCVFFTAVGLSRGDKADVVFTEIKTNFWRLMRAGWKLWPAVHVITYTVIPSEHKVLWVDTVEIVWATILCLVVNEKRGKSVDTLAALETSAPAVNDAVVNAIGGFVQEVRELQWESELQSRADAEVTTPFVSEHVPMDLQAANEVAALVQQEVALLMQHELELEIIKLNQGTYQETPQELENLQMMEELIGQLEAPDEGMRAFDVPLETKVAMADALEAMVGEAHDAYHNASHESVTP
eukprot:CAMPEP_0198229006 /NCGR_PEP_ID=MMETSP1445-20131203/113896_1 /TAXON_ID=36898 /ORGANISM="Pyramimonas sp., Strain CCMP2087" /LENGTH=438 /DNA_ID=CAMNT_0043909443 /DNA_START=485 /DNA_END=1801 /DNA_ORIENTATION=+